MSNPPVEKVQKDENKKKEDALKKFKVANKYDPYLLKNSLDECIKEILKEKIKATENHRYENTKILLGIVICSIVALSHYYPSPFPENYYLIILCIIGYAILTAIYTYFESKIEKDCFILFNIKDKPPMRFSSKIPLCSEFYEITLTDYNNLNEIAKKESIGNFFDIKGNISYMKVDLLVHEMITQYFKKFI